MLALAEKKSLENGSSLVDSLDNDEVFKKVPKDAKEDWESLLETLRNLDVLAATAKPAQVVEGAIEGWYQDYLRATYENWPRREEDLESLVDFASKYETLAEMLSQLVLLSSESGDRVVTKGERCLRLSTIHQSKGLEFPHVFVIGLADGLFPNKRAIDGEGDLEEERRLFYVAATRAERSLHLVFPMLSNQKGVPVRLVQSRFLKEISESRYDLHNAHSAFGPGRQFGNWNYRQNRGDRGFGSRSF